MENKIIIYTDGASSGNPGPGGWGAVIRDGEKVKEIGGFDLNTTNNRMEMTAAIESLKSIKVSTIKNKTSKLKKEDLENKIEIVIYTDSSYLINGITKWIFNWRRNNWKTKQGDDVLNKDLWQKLELQINQGKISWVHVAGHAGIKLNNRVDEIAVSFSKALDDKEKQPELFSGPAEKYQFKVEAPTAEEIKIPKKKGSSGSISTKGQINTKNKKAFSYLSMVDDRIEKHETWDACKNRVNGQSGARYRKTFSKEHESEIIKEWQVK